MNRIEHPGQTPHAPLTAPLEFNWADVRQRIARASAALTDSQMTSPEALAQLFARRAEQLAQATLEQDHGEQINLVLVQLGHEVYSLDAQYVAEMRPLERLTRVPRVPAWVAGVINWRGNVLSVIDLQRLWDLPRLERAAGDEAAAPYLVVVGVGEMFVALLVDAVLAVEALPISRVHDATGTVRGLRAEYVQGIAERGGESGAALVILNLPAVLTDKQFIIHEEIV